MTDDCADEAFATCGEGETKLSKAAAKAAAKERRKARKAEKKAWKRARPKREPWISPILCVSDVRARAELYERAFGFEVELVLDGSDGKAVHAMLRHRRGVIMLGGPSTWHGSGSQQTVPPAQAPGTTVSLYVYVADVDALVARAANEGIKVLTPPADEFWGDRCARLLDPEGHVWMFATHLRKSARSEEESCESEDSTSDTTASPTEPTATAH
ncbi:VOC family protein [bacterium]|nr:VOC family protein [bacterium]